MGMQRGCREPINQTPDVLNWAEPAPLEFLGGGGSHRCVCHSLSFNKDSTEREQYCTQNRILTEENRIVHRMYD